MKIEKQTGMNWWRKAGQAHIQTRKRIHRLKTVKLWPRRWDVLECRMESDWRQKAHLKSSDWREGSSLQAVINLLTPPSKRPLPLIHEWDLSLRRNVKLVSELPLLLPKGQMKKHAGKAGRGARIGWTQMENNSGIDGTGSANWLDSETGEMK